MDGCRHCIPCSLERVEAAQSRMEIAMATAKEQLGELKSAFTDFASDVDAKLNQLLQAQGTLQPDAQAVFDDLKASVQAADDRVGDADGSDTPPPADTEEPDTTPVGEGDAEPTA